MELRQLEYLVAVADDGGFSRAARRLHLSQPALSTQVRKLEAELGESLLDRSGGAVTPTDVGAAVLEHARAALAAAERVRGAVDEHAGLLRGRVSIGVIASGIPPELPDLLASFAREHPAVELSLSEGRGTDRVAGLLDGRLDLAIVGLLGDPPAGVATTTLRDEPVVVAVAPDDPIAGREAVRLHDLLDRPLIALPDGTGLRAGLDTAFAVLGASPRIAYEAGTPVVLCELARRGLGVALVPASAADFVPGVEAVPLKDPALRGRIDLAWPDARPVSPAGRALIAHVRRGVTI